MLRAALILAAALALGGCAVTRPAPVACFAPPTTVAATRGHAPEPMAPMLDAIRAEVRATPPGRPVTFQVASLSAGGQFGAFGAGFLDGWSDNPATPRPRFDMVTGVSAGAILAPAVFAGPAFDDVLRVFRGLAADDVSRRRPLLAILRAPSFATPAPLERTLRERVDAALMAAIAARRRDGDALLVAATNLDTSRFTVFDLGEVAADRAPAAAAACVREAILASAAIPGLLPPRNIDGALYADGGLRDQVFLTAIDTARARVARETGRAIRVEASLIVNAALREPSNRAPDSLPGYVGRAVTILADEVLRDSIVEAVAFARARPAWTLRGVVSEADVTGPCGLDDVPTGTFDACVTRELYDEGLRRGRAAPIRWLDADALEALALDL